MDRINTIRTARVKHHDDAAKYFFCEMDRDQRNSVLSVATLSQWRAFVDGQKEMIVSKVIAPRSLCGSKRILYNCVIYPGQKYVHSVCFDGGQVFVSRGRLEICEAITTADAWGEE